MFYDLELEEECANIFGNFPWMTSDKDEIGSKNKTNKIQMEIKVLGKGHKVKYHCEPGQLFFHLLFKSY